jgi:hypothetical protein
MSTETIVGVGGVGVGVGAAIGAIGKEAAPVVARCLERLLGPAASELGDGLAIALRRWKLSNLARLDAKVEVLIRQRALDGKTIPEAFALPLIEEAIKTDDEGLLDSWAKLMVAGVEDDDARSPIYRQTLAMFSPGTARAFEQLMSITVDWREQVTSGAAEAELKEGRIVSRVPVERIPESVRAHKHEFLTAGIIHDQPLGLPMFSSSAMNDYAVSAYANRLAKHLKLKSWPTDEVDVKPEISRQQDEVATKLIFRRQEEEKGQS